MPKSTGPVPDQTHQAPKRPPAPRNRTLKVEAAEIEELGKRIIQAEPDKTIRPDGLICGDAFEVLRRIEPESVDLLFADPPYNLSKKFGEESFRRKSEADYEQWLDLWIRLCKPLLKPRASIYICGDWRSSSAIYRVGTNYFIPRNRITWEREKGRGAKRNWKNTSEDIWFFTLSDRYVFNLESVKQRRRVIAPYRENGHPKDWQPTAGGKFRDTHPSNLWTDITVPFWSMPENTYHPTQKPEKLLAKIILASTNPSDVVLDPFAGSGTTAVVAAKLGRRFIAIERDSQYCLLAAKRICLAEQHTEIQGLSDGVFWERNSQPR